MTDAVTATVIETPKPERPTLYANIYPPCEHRDWSLGSHIFYKTETDAAQWAVDGAQLLVIPGTAAQREYAEWCGKVRELAEWVSQRKEVFAGSHAADMVLAVLAGLPKETP